MGGCRIFGACRYLPRWLVVLWSQGKRGHFDLRRIWTSSDEKHSNPAELQSSRANLIRRLYWHCSIMET